MNEHYKMICDDLARRKAVLEHPTLNGIDYIEVPKDGQRDVNVHFLKPDAGFIPLLEPDQVRIEGGVRIKDIHVERIMLVTNGDTYLHVLVDKPGDFSTYMLIIEDPESVNIDVIYSRHPFSFKAGCPSDFDCGRGLVCPIEPREEPVIDYMAKDYASFRRALIDFIPTLLPDWTERHEADLGIALVELLAYVGDQLSYYQDAAANEAYLETARQRESVKRHARLIDYSMHDGASARTFVHVALEPDTWGTLPAQTQILSRIEVPLGSTMPPHGPVIPADLKDQALDFAEAVFETIADAYVHSDLNEIEIYTWGNKECCLPKGETSADLKNDLTAHLKPGDFLLFEEVKGPETGLEADADPKHRQVVRLTGVDKTQDPLFGIDLTRVTWDRADALAFPLCISTELTDSTPVDNVSMARGNLVLADHGRTIFDEQHSGPQEPIHASLRCAHRVHLTEGPLSFRIPLPDENGSWTPAKEFLATDPHQAIPQVTRLVVSSTTPPDDWKPVVPHLLDSDPFDHHFVVETDNDGRAILRFGDDEFGMAPLDGSDIFVTYRVGVGRKGNIGMESLVHIVEPEPLPPDWPEIASVTPELPKPVRNTLSAWGGIEPETNDQVKLLAPKAFHAEQFRAVTEDDYVVAAEKYSEVSKAVATFRWTGSWHTVFLTIDPVGQTDLTEDMESRIRSHIARYRLAGYDIEIDPPIYVPLEIEINVCAARDHFRAHVKEALINALSNRAFPDRSKGFFHPDDFTFAQSVYLSKLYKAVEQVDGVDSAEVIQFKRFGQKEDGELEQGYIPIGRLEVARLDNDPSYPENGILRLNMMGGK